MMRLATLALSLCLASFVCAHDDAAYRKIVYYTNWAQYRPCNKFFPENIQPIAKGLTHIHYAFAKFDTSGTVIPIEWNDCAEGQWPGCQGYGNTTMYNRVLNLKSINPNLKVVITFGGWSWGGVVVCPTFSTMAASQSSRAQFISQSIKFARTFKFDGVEIDWEFPGSGELGCKTFDTANFVSLVSEMATAIAAEAQSSGKPRLIFSVASPAGKPNIDTYNLPAVQGHLDYINLMSYDYHGTWENVTGLNAPLYDSGDNLSINFTVNYYKSLGVTPSKINLGFGTYGHSFAIASGRSAPYPIGTPVSGAGSAGPCTAQPGTLAYYEIEALLKTGGVTKVYNATVQAPYLYSSSGNPWVGYDDTQSFAAKLAYLQKAGLGGAMAWAVDLDDFAGGYPLMNTIITSLN